MMARNIRTIIRKARKDHIDDSIVFIEESMNCLNGELTFAEWRAIASLKANNWRIKKGQLYEFQTNEMDGEIYTFKSLPIIVKICQRLGLYDY